MKIVNALPKKTDLAKDIEILEEQVVLKVNSAEKGVPNGVATLNSDGKVPEEQLDIQADQVMMASGESVEEIFATLADEGLAVQLMVDEDNNTILTEYGEEIESTTLFGWKIADTLIEDYNTKFQTTTGRYLGLTVDSSTYVMTFSLLNQNQEVLDSKTIDLPLESMVVNATCSGTTLTLTLQNGNKVNVDVSSIVSGLVPTSRKIAGLDLVDDIATAELQQVLGISGTNSILARLVVLENSIKVIDNIIIPRLQALEMTAESSILMDTPYEVVD